MSFFTCVILWFANSVDTLYESRFLPKSAVRVLTITLRITPHTMDTRMTEARWIGDDSDTEEEETEEGKELDRALEQFPPVGWNGKPLSRK